MEYRIKVSANAKREAVILLRDGRLAVHVDAPPKDGRANERACELVARYLGVEADRVVVSSGHNQPTKVLTVKGMKEPEAIKK